MEANAILCQVKVPFFVFIFYRLSKNICTYLKKTLRNYLYHSKYTRTATYIEQLC